MDSMDAKTVSEMEETETETNKTKVSDSGYSNSGSNSQSQRSNSSKSRHSNSSGSSGYCGHPSSTLGSSGDEHHKMKKSKLQPTAPTPETTEPVPTADTSFTPPHPANKITVKKVIPTCVDPAVLDNMSSPTIDSESLQVAVLAQTLFCIKTKSTGQSFDDQDLHTPPPENKEPESTEMIISALKDELKHEKEFCIVVSLSDGTVVYTTASLTNVLGFPKDMWIGRSLINFLHPKDRIAFASHITSAMARSHFKQNSATSNSTDKVDEGCYFYCWIRMYSGLKTSGFNVADKKTVYLPCQLSMNFKEVPDQGVFLVATARQVKSAYKVPGENRGNPPTFTIRHTANTLISHVDNDVVSHFGYLPHDMIGRSIFDFYYAEDLPYLKDVYTNVIMEEGLLFLSRPYKFRCQNGDCVMVETEWSSFINPWGKKLEFIIGRHRVLTGPHNPDVVGPLTDREVVVNQEDIHSESKVFQEEIKVLLTEPIVRSYEPSKQQLAQLVESLEKISSSKIRDQSLGVPVPSAASEMLGKISPHHVYSDSKSSSETPPSYNQLTYNENIQRFFASEPKTAGSDESADQQKEPNQSSSSGGEEGKSLSNNPSFNSNSDSCLNGSGNGSGENSTRITSNSTSRPDRTKQDPITKTKKQGISNVHCEYRTRPLTEEMLYQHNENMNKQMAQKHKQEKSKGQGNRKHKNAQHKNSEDVEQDEQEGHGMKRSLSHSWEGEPMKAFKGAHPDQAAMAAHSGRVRMRGAPNPAVWSGPSYSVQQPQQPSVVENPVYADLRNYSSSLINPLVQLPCVYMNTLPPGPAPNPVLRAQVNNGTEHPGPPLALHRVPMPVPVPAPPPIPHIPQPVQYMPSLMYQLPLVPMVYTQPHIIPPIVKPRMTYIPTVTHPTTCIPQQQPSSRDTSIKAEPGSAMCSFASASVKQGLSDSSKKENKSRASSPVYSPGGFTSNTGKTKNGTYDNDFTHDDTSFCSYSSLFPKTEKSDDSMKSSQDKVGSHFKVWRSTAASDTHSTLRTLRKEPSWMENVEVTQDLMLRYQMDSCVLSQVLQSDFEALLKFNQPELVNEQLDQLYIDLEGLSKQLSLEESFPSSCSSSDEKARSSTPLPSTSSSNLAKTKKKKRFMGHDKCAMIFEEDAPMPPSASEMLAIAVHSS